MSAEVKKWINRIGLGLTVGGLVAIFIGGGDADAAVTTAESVVTIVGAVILVVKEVWQSLKNANP